MKRKYKVVLIIIIIAISTVMLVREVRSIRGRYKTIDLPGYESRETDTYKIHYYLTISEICEEADIQVEEIFDAMPFEYEEGDEQKSIRKLSKEKGVKKEEIAKAIRDLVSEKEGKQNE